MRISKTSTLVIVLLSSLSLTLTGCGNKKTSAPTTTTPYPVPSTTNSNDTKTSNTQSNSTQNNALLDEINAKLDLLINNLKIVHAQQNKPMIEFYKSPSCIYTLVAQQQLLELGNSGSVSMSDLSAVSSKIPELRSLAGCTN